MESYQVVQNRAGQTIAVVNENVPTLTVGGIDAATLLSRSEALSGLAQTRDDALAAYDEANNAENLGYLRIRSLALSLPASAEGELDDAVAAESALLELLEPVYAITPRTTELALERAQKLISALGKINPYLAAQTPARGPITSGGRGIAELTDLVAAQPALEQALEDRDADVSTARNALRVARTGVDRLNKRFYRKLQGEARTNEALAMAMNQIDTESDNQPHTLGIRSILQGGADGLHILVSYDPGTFEDGAQSAIEWQVVGTDADFSNSAVADPSGNDLGAFAVGQTVNIRTRVTNSNGTTTGSVRTLTIQPGV